MEADVRLDMFEETSKQFTTHEDIVGLTVNDTLYVNGVGPFTDFDEVASRTFTVQTEAFEEFIGGGMTKWRLFRSTDNTDISAGSILMMDGRRYKVRSVEDDAAGYNASQITLTETYAGGQLLKLCDACVSSNGANNLFFSKKQTLKVGDQLLIENQIHESKMVSVLNDVVNSNSVVVSTGTKYGKPLFLTSTDSGGEAHLNLDLYKVLNTEGFKPTLVTEASAAVTYQYVSQCSNRGLCDSSVGLCTCFKGYTHDNCDTQNMLVM
jgi:hypothetical protein